MHLHTMIPDRDDLDDERQAHRRRMDLDHATGAGRLEIAGVVVHARLRGEPIADDVLLADLVFALRRLLGEREDLSRHRLIRRVARSLQLGRRRATRDERGDARADYTRNPNPHPPTLAYAVLRLRSALSSEAFMQRWYAVRQGRMPGCSPGSRVRQEQRVHAAVLGTLRLAVEHEAGVEPSTPADAN